MSHLINKSIYDRIEIQQKAKKIRLIDSDFYEFYSKPIVSHLLSSRCVGKIAHLNSLIDSKRSRRFENVLKVSKIAHYCLLADPPPKMSHLVSVLSKMMASDRSNIQQKKKLLEASR